ncbi:MAG TPA: aquaporin [Candidatus Dormibacteraeota bacterium]|nr:aquaporin [Candidatus Dormibacteraeota bacterium]
MATSTNTDWVGSWTPHVEEWACELAGTALLLVGGLTAVTVDFGVRSPVVGWLPSVGTRLLLTGAIFAGTGSLVAISPIGRRSGAHLNPAVSLAFWLTGHMHPRDLLGYWVSQVLGAVLGAGLVRLVWGELALSVHVGVTHPGPGISMPAAAAIEGLMTAALILVIFWFVADPGRMRYTPLAVWVLITILVWKVAPLTGTSLNPARSMGPAIADWYFSCWWVYIVGPLSGASLAVLIARAISQVLWPGTAKLFHDASYPTIFRHGGRRHAQMFQ